MKIKVKYNIFILLFFILVSCGGNTSVGNLADQSSGNLTEYENSAVNGVAQALPTIMMIPADQTLQNFGSLKNMKQDGNSFMFRDYNKYLIADDRFRRIVSTVQSSFNADNYPLQDFEQTLKQLDSKGSIDIADDLAQDAKTLLLQTAQPDIILEFNYHVNGGGQSLRSNKNISKEKSISYTLSAIDAYTNKVISTITESNIKGESTTQSIQKSMENKLPKLKKEIVKYFSDIQTRGRNVTLRVTVAAESNQNLSDESIEGDTYSDYIMDYVKNHTVKGAYKMQINTKDELYLVNMRIPLINEDGTQYGVYEWARDLTRAMRKDLGVKVSNQSQGLGEISLKIEGFPNL